MTKLVIANWKSHKSPSQVQPWVAELGRRFQPPAAELEIAIAPSFPLLPELQTQLRGVTNLSAIHLAVQDISPFAAGAYTGAVSAENLKDLGIRYGILGHSERRRYFHETNIEVANKVDQCLQQNIVPIVCVDDAYINEQASALSHDQLVKCWVAYEALDAIGSGQPQPLSEVTERAHQIEAAFGHGNVLYGGSVSAANVAEYLTVTNGVLVGTASLAAEQFAALITAAVS